MISKVKQRAPVREVSEPRANLLVQEVGLIEAEETFVGKENIASLARNHNIRCEFDTKNTFYNERTLLNDRQSVSKRAFSQPEARDICGRRLCSRPMFCSLLMVLA
jgi:hypothetical protein